MTPRLSEDFNLTGRVSWLGTHGSERVMVIDAGPAGETTAVTVVLPDRYADPAHVRRVAVGDDVLVWGCLTGPNPDGIGGNCLVCDGDASLRVDAACMYDAHTGEAVIA